MARDLFSPIGILDETHGAVTRTAAPWLGVLWLCTIPYRLAQVYFIHEVLTLAHRAGNTARKRFIDALRALHDSRLHFELGFPSSVAYADAKFHLSRTQTLESIRVSRALLELPHLAGAFERGEVS